jgi:hypothetical protein
MAPLIRRKFFAHSQPANARKEKSGQETLIQKSIPPNKKRERL